MSNSSFLQVLKGETISPNPMWFMRQAGRYLPEYRKVREEAGSFLNLCFNPELAAEVTLQPIRRYDLDAAILFADILLIPKFMGQDLAFETGEGPRLRPSLQEEQVKLTIESVDENLAPVMETIKLCRAGLDDNKALIGFAGAPWTVATYMIAGRGVKDPSALRAYAYEQPEQFDHLMKLLEAATVSYLKNQIEAGVQTVQLFESWASGLPSAFLRKYCLEPAIRISAAIHETYPDFPVIAFPKGAGQLLEDYAKSAVFSGLGIDSATDPVWAANALSPHVTVQGGLDQLLVVQGGKQMFEAADQLMSAFAGKPYIMNLGHGFVPHTPPENVGALVDFVRGK